MHCLKSFFDCLVMILSGISHTINEIEVDVEKTERKPISIWKGHIQ